VSAGSNTCERLELVSAYALRALPEDERAAVEAHIAVCATCTEELARLRPVVDSFASWPSDVLRPSESVWERLESVVGADAADRSAGTARERWKEPDWEQVAPGIACKLLATDTERQRVSMLVRLEPGTAYPPHTHAGVEELHLLEGELWIGERKLLPGDYNHAEPGTFDVRVFSETGCTCVLITSPGDVLR
jgi:anti-sigma factor ChrR (cupin superfamily)